MELLRRARFPQLVRHRDLSLPPLIFAPISLALAIVVLGVEVMVVLVMRVVAAALVEIRLACLTVESGGRHRLLLSCWCVRLDSVLQRNCVPEKSVVMVKECWSKKSLRSLYSCRIESSF